jgi:septal ring factor EnvC (AmiA/AmiB activator)
MDQQEIMAEVRELKRQHEKQRDKINELHTSLYTLIESQKITTRNMERLTEDIKDILKSSSSIEVVEKEIVMINHRLKDLEDNKAWLFKMVVGAVVMAGIGLIIDFKHAKGGIKP